MNQRDWMWLAGLVLAWLNVAVLAWRLREGQRYYRSLLNAFEHERSAHKATREAKIMQVRSDPLVPRGTMLIFSPGGVQ